MRALAIALLVLSVHTAHAVTRYVSTTGSDSNSCATSTVSGVFAKRNINGASGGISCMAAGDTLIVQSGTYNEHISDVNDSEHPGSTRPPNGTSWSAPTVIKSEVPRGATVNKPAAGPPQNHTVYLTLSSTQYISVEDFVIDGRGHGACVWVGPASHIQIKGNEIKNCGNNGMYVSVDDFGGGGVDVRVINNEIHNVSMEVGDFPGSHGVYYTGNNGTISGNFVYGCPFYGIHATSELGGLHTNMIENNRVYGCGQAGIISQGTATVVRNNLLENNCIGIFLTANSTKVLNNTIFDFEHSNTCGGCLGCSSESYGILDNSGGSSIHNNLILQQRDVSSVRRYLNYAGSPSLLANMCDNVEAQNCQITITPFSTIVVNGILSTGNTPVASNLQLLSTSPAVNAGFTNTDVAVDRLGVARPQGSAYDIGAYEFSAGGDVIPPSVSITSPSGGATLSGTVSITATATDDIAVVGVQFKVDGGNLGAEDTSAPYGVSWDTTLYSNGPHSLTAVARDSVNSTTSAGVSVTVSNGAPSGGVKARRVYQW